MKRRTVHTGFLLATVASATWLGLQGVDWQQRLSINAAVDAVPATLGEPIERSSVDADTPARAQLAEATALAAGDAFDAAEQRFTDLMQGAPPSTLLSWWSADDADDGEAIARAARFNLANAYLRVALAADTPANTVMPWVELAKQHYRDLLRLDADDWEARYNLEQALRQAPEQGELEVDERGEPVKSVRVIVPGFEARDLP